MTQKKAIIFGVTGQDGSYLAEFLLDKGYEVHGVIRRSSSFNTKRIEHIFGRLHLHFGDLSDATSIVSVLQEIKPNEIYNLGAQSHVRVSFDIPLYTADVDALGTLRVLETARSVCPEVKYYQASSSELYGSTPAPQNEESAFHPRSPYGISKLFSYWYTVNARERGMFACNGILFNHESPRRGETFVTRKITKAVARIKLGLQDKLLLGNLDAKRDWGYAKEYVECMWLMLQHGYPDDYVVATGETHTVMEFLDVSFGALGLSWNKYVGIDPKYYRPTEVDILQGDASKIKRTLGWTPKVKFEELVRTMTEADYDAEKSGCNRG